MKFSLTATIFAFSSLLAASSAVQAGATLDRVTQKQEMVVATNGSWYPQGYLDENNQLAGFDVDVANELGRRLGVAVKFETPEFAFMTGGHWNGRFDIAIGSVTPTKARAQVIDFASIYYYSPYVYVVHKDSQAQSVEDLNGKIIGVETGTTSEDYINRRLEIEAEGMPPIEYKLEPGEVRTFADSMLPFDDLRLGDGVRVHAVIAPEQTAQGAVDNGYPVRIIAGEYAFYEPLVIIAEKGDPEWVARVHQAVEEMKQDGALAELTTKWYGKDYSNASF